MVTDVVSALLSQSFTLRIVKLLYFLDQHEAAFYWCSNNNLIC